MYGVNCSCPSFTERNFGDHVVYVLSGSKTSRNSVSQGLAMEHPSKQTKEMLLFYFHCGYSLYICVTLGIFAAV